MAMQEASKYYGERNPFAESYGERSPLNLAGNYYGPYQGNVNYPQQSLNAPSIADYPTMAGNVSLTQPYQPLPDQFNIPDAARDVGIAGGGFALQESQARAIKAEEKYHTELERLRNKHYWWNPQYDVHAELSEYVEDIPSRRDKLIDSTLTSGALGGGAAEYAHHKGGQRALQGAAMGSIVPGWGTAIGAIAGGLVGLVEGFFTWGKAAEEDKELREAQEKQYERDLRKWEAQREKLISDYNKQVRATQLQGQLSRSTRLKAERKQEEQEAASRRYQKYANMINSIRSAVQAQQQRRDRLQSLSRHLQPLGA